MLNKSPTAKDSYTPLPLFIKNYGNSGFHQNYDANRIASFLPPHNVKCISPEQEEAFLSVLEDVRKKDPADALQIAEQFHSLATRACPYCTTEDCEFREPKLNLFKG